MATLHGNSLLQARAMAALHHIASQQAPAAGHLALAGTSLGHPAGGAPMGTCCGALCLSGTCCRASRLQCIILAQLAFSIFHPADSACCGMHLHKGIVLAKHPPAPEEHLPGGDPAGSASILLRKALAVGPCRRTNSPSPWLRRFTLASSTCTVTISPNGSAYRMQTAPLNYIGMTASRPMSEDCGGILLAAYHSASAGTCCAASCRRLPVGD